MAFVVWKRREADTHHQNRIDEGEESNDSCKRWQTRDEELSSWEIYCYMVVTGLREPDDDLGRIFDGLPVRSHKMKCTRIVKKM